MALREIVASLGYQLDSSSESNVTSSLGKVKKLAIAAAAAFAATKLVSGIKDTVEETRALGDEIDKTSQRLGVNAQALQELRFAAGLAGASNAAVTTSLQKLAKNANEAAMGSKGFQEDFAKLGVTVKDANGQLKPSEQLFTEVGAAIGEMESDSERLALSQSLLGRSGAELIPLFTQGADAIADQRKEARELGGVMDKDLIGISVAFTDNLSRLGFVIRGITLQVAKAFMPAFDEVVMALTDLGRQLRGPIRIGMSVLASSFEVVGKAIGFLVRNLPTILALFGAWLALSFPLTAVLLGLVGVVLLLIDEFVKMGKGGNTVIGGLIGEFWHWVDETESVVASIGQILLNAFAFWGSMIADLFGDEVRKEFDDIIVFMRDWINRLGKFINDEISFANLVFNADDFDLKNMARTIASDLGFENFIPRFQGGEPFSGGAGGGGTSVMARNNANVQVTVDASGSTASADDIGMATGRAVRSNLEPVLQNAQRNLVP